MKDTGPGEKKLHIQLRVKKFIVKRFLMTWFTLLNQLVSLESMVVAESELCVNATYYRAYQ